MSTDNGSICVVLVISNLEYGGAQRQVVELANHMDRAVFDVHICSLSDYVPLAGDLVDRDRRLHIIQKRHKYDVTTALRLANLLRELHADVVHGFLFDAQIASRLAGRFSGTPLVVASERNTNYTLKWRHLAAYRLTRSYVDMCIANSNAGAVFNRRVQKLDASQYAVVHNGVNTDRFRPRDRAELRHALGLTAHELVVGMFASFKKQKNHPLFLAAARVVAERFDNTRFLLVGDALHGGLQDSDAHRRSGDALMESLGLQDRCLLLDNSLHPEDLYPACDVTVLPSVHEGTPNVILESMACGVPVVATDVSDNAYVVPDGQVGYVVPLGDEAMLADRVCRLIGETSLRQRMGQNARKWVEAEFSLARLASKTARVYLDGLRCSAQTVTACD